MPMILAWTDVQNRPHSQADVNSYGFHAVNVVYYIEYYF